MQMEWLMRHSWVLMISLVVILITLMAIVAGLILTPGGSTHEDELY